MSLTPKSAAIFLIDCSSSMNKLIDKVEEGEGEGRKNRLDVVKEYVKAKIVQRVMRDLKTIPSSTILYGYSKTKNLLTSQAKELAREQGAKFDRSRDAYQGIYELVPLNWSPDGGTVERIDLAEAGLSEVDGDSLSALICAIETLDGQPSLKKYPTKEIFILTDGESENNWDQFEGTTERMIELGISLKVVGIDFDDDEVNFVEENKAETKRENEEHFHKIVDTLNSSDKIPGPSLVANATRALETISEPRIKLVNSRSDKMTLTLGDPEEHPDRSIVMYVDVKKAVVPATIPSMKKMSMAGFEKVGNGESQRGGGAFSQSQGFLGGGGGTKRGREEMESDERKKNSAEAFNSKHRHSMLSSSRTDGSVSMGKIGANLEKTLKAAGLAEGDGEDSDLLAHNVEIDRRLFYRPSPPKKENGTGEAGPSQVRVTRRTRIGADSDEDEDEGRDAEFDEDDWEEVQEGAEISEAHHYGGDLIPTGDFEDNIGVLGGLKTGMEIISFTKKDDVRFDWRMGDVFYVYASIGQSGSEKIFSAFVNALEEKNSCAVVRFVKKGFTSSKTGSVVMPDPQVGLLHPATDGQGAEFCYYVRLPFGEDVRPFHFASLSNLFNSKGHRIDTHHRLPTKEQDEAMDAFVDAMDLKKVAKVDADGETVLWFDIHQSSSPAIHNIQNTLMYRLTNPDGELPPVPRTLLRYMDPPRDLVESASESIQKAIDAFDVKLIPPKPKKSTRANQMISQPDKEIRPDTERLFGHGTPSDEIAASKPPRASRVTVNAAGLELKESQLMPSQSTLKPIDEQREDAEMENEPETEDEDDDSPAPTATTTATSVQGTASTIDIREVVDEARRLVETSFSRQNFGSATTELKRARNEAIRSRSSSLYNSALRNLVDKISNHQHANYLKTIVKEDLGLIVDGETTADDAEAFLEVL